MTKTWLGRVKEGVYLRPTALWRKALQQKVVTGSLLLALLPLPLISPALSGGKTSGPWQTQLVLANAAPELLTSQPQSIQIEKTVSRYQEEEAKKLASQKKARLQVATVTPKVTNVSEEEKWHLANKAANAYGIPTQLLLAVWRVESGMQWYTNTHSGAGATGPFQFMPGTWRGYAVDGNGDGVKDIHAAEDAAYAAAKLLATNGASQGDYRRALLSYNHADWYVKKVLTLANM